MNKIINYTPKIQIWYKNELDEMDYCVADKISRDKIENALMKDWLVVVEWVTISKFRLVVIKEYNWDDPYTIALNQTWSVREEIVKRIMQRKKENRTTSKQQVLDQIEQLNKLSEKRVEKEIIYKRAF